MTTKQFALALYATARETGEYEAAAHALAAAISPPRVVRSDTAPKRNKSRSLTSRAWSGGRVPLFTKQACGHVFNSAGCPTCPYCERIPARISDVVGAGALLQDRVNGLVVAEAIAEMLTRVFPASRAVAA